MTPNCKDETHIKALFNISCNILYKILENCAGCYRTEVRNKRGRAWVPVGRG